MKVILNCGSLLLLNIMECDKHQDCEILYVCVPCTYALVCSKCLIESHNGHRMISFDEAKVIVEKRLQNKASENANLIFDLMTRIEKLAKASKDQNEAADRIKSKVKQGQKKLHHLVDKYADQTTASCDSMLKKNCESIQNQTVLLTKQITEAKQFRTRIKEILNKKSALSIIEEFGKLVPPTMQETEFQYPNTLQYIQHPITSESILAHYGSIVNDSIEDIKSVKSFTHFETVAGNISTMDKGSDFVEFAKKNMLLSSEVHLSTSKAIDVMVPNSDGLCWVKCFRETVLRLIDEKGVVHQNVKIKVDRITGVVISNDGFVLASSATPNCIQKVDLKTGKVNIFFSTEYLIPQDLGCTSTGELFVTLIDDNTHDLNPFSKRLIAKYTKNGQELAIVERDRFNEKLFIGPTKLRINPAENTVAVVNEVSHDLSYLVLLDWQLNVKLRYLGHGRLVQGDQRFFTPKPGHKFYIFDASFDKATGNILISEEFSKSVHLLSPSCVELQILFTDNVILWSLAVHNGDKLWIGREDGIIKVLQLRDDK